MVFARECPGQRWAVTGGEVRGSFFCFFCHRFPHSHSQPTIKYWEEGWKKWMLFGTRIRDQENRMKVFRDFNWDRLSHFSLVSLVWKLFLLSLFHTDLIFFGTSSLPQY